MADRRASVSLELKASAFKAEVTESAAKVEGLDRQVEKLDRSITKIPPDAAKAAAAMKLLGDESGKAGVKLDEMGRRSTGLGAIDQEIAKARNEVRLLGEEFNRTGDSSVLSKLFGKQSELKDLERLGKRLATAVGEDGKMAGQEFMKNFSASIRGWASTPVVGPITAGVLTAAIVAASPLITATLNGAVLAGLGLGGIGLGIVGQLRDPGVHAAFVDMGHDLSAELTSSTISFRQPLIESAGIFGNALHKAIDSVDFGALSKMLVPLASGTGGLLTNMMPGFNKALEAARPVLQALAQELPKLGSAISDMFQKFGRGKDGAVIAIKLIIDALRVLAEVIGNVVEIGSKFTEWITTHLAKAFHAISEAAGTLHMSGLKRGADEVATALDNLSNIDTSGLDKFGGAATKAGGDLSGLMDKINATAVTADTVAAAMAGKIFNAMMSVDQATLAWHQSLTSLGDTLQQNGLAIDRHTHQIADNTTQGEANRSAILGAVQANMAQYQAQVAAGMSATDAAAAYDANTAALERQLRKAGLTQQQIDGLIGKYKAVPDEVNTEIALRGIGPAIDRLIDLIGLINNIPAFRQVDIQVRESVSRQLSDPSSFGHVQRWGGIYQHAAEGLVNAKVFPPSGAGRYVVAEGGTGGEAFVPRFGDYGRSTSILDQASRWYGGRFAAGGGSGVVNINVTVPVNAGLIADQGQLPSLISEQVVKSMRSGGAIKQYFRQMINNPGM
jgi:hypothetical protein